MFVGKKYSKGLSGLIKGSVSFFFALVFFLSIYIAPVAAVTIEEQFSGKTLSETAAKENIKKSSGKDKYPVVEYNYPVKKVSQQPKDPRLACLLSLMIPGAGHIYLRKDLKGAGFCLAAGTGYSFAGYFLYDAVAGSSGNRSDYIMSGLFFLIASIIHITGIVEAYNDAEEYNLRLSEGRDPYTGN